MVCTCDVELTREAEARRRRIFQRMNLERSEDLTPAVVMSLAFDFQADAVIYADQWFGVRVDTQLIPEGVFASCDHPADGLAAIWEYLAEQYPDLVSRNPSLRQSLSITERIVDALFAKYAEAENRYRDHRDQSHGRYAPCEDCVVLGGLSILFRRTLEGFWGFRDLDPAVDAACKDRWG